MSLTLEETDDASIDDPGRDGALFGWFGGAEPGTGNDYFDVHLVAMTPPASVVITDCTAGDESLDWYNPATQAFAQVLASDVNGCLQATIASTSTPNLTELGGLIFGGSASPTWTPVTHFRVKHSGRRLIATWRVASRARIVGFDLYARGRRLNTRLIPVHEAQAYVYRTRWLPGPYRLHILLRDGREVTARPASGESAIGVEYACDRSRIGRPGMIRPMKAYESG